MRAPAKTYTSCPCPRGHDLRYVSTDKCVVCVSELGVKWREENREYHRESARVWHAVHPKQAKQTDREWKSRNKEQRAIANLDWRIANPDKVKAARAARRARKKSAEGNFTSVDIEELLAVQSDQCVGCETGFVDLGYTVDHIIPLVHGGSNWPSNLQLLCQSCNSSKGAKTMEEWKNG